MRPCPVCSSPLTIRRPSKRRGETLLECTGPDRHKCQMRNDSGIVYRVNYPGRRGEGRKIATITTSQAERELMARHGVKQQQTFELGLEVLREREKQ